MTCQKVIGVAQAMKKIFGDTLLLDIYTNSSKEAEAYDLKASTTVFIDNEWIPIDIATSEDRMQEFLKKRIG